MKRELGDGYELDDDPKRIDTQAVFEYLSGESYWARGRSRETIERLIREAQRVVGVYKDGKQVGFSRTVTDGVAFAYLADLYVLPEHQGRGLGKELVQETVVRGPYSKRRWLLHTHDAHDLYRQFGFGEPSDTLMERRVT